MYKAIYKLNVKGYTDLKLNFKNNIYEFKYFLKFKIKELNSTPTLKLELLAQYRAQYAITFQEYVWLWIIDNIFVVF